MLAHTNEYVTVPCLVSVCCEWQTDIVSEKVVRPAASEADRNCATLHAVEGLALVMLCSSKPVIRKQAVIMLKESRNLFTVLDVPKVSPDLFTVLYVPKVSLVLSAVSVTLSR